MKKAHYILFVLLLILWGVGCFSLKIGFSIHLLLVSALGLMLIKLLQENKAESN